MNEPIAVLLADDQDLLRASLATVIGADARIRVAGEVGDGDAAVEFVRSHRVDVVLMDIRMPGMDGIAATAEVLRLRPETRVLILTTFDLDENVFAAVRAGASGFLTKDMRPAELIDAICKVADGDAAVSPRATASLLRHVRHQVFPQGDPLEALTPRERDVFRLLARGASNAEIGARLYLTENTVKSHVRSVLAGLQLPDRIQVVIWAYENGLIRPGEAGDAPPGA
ncbi:response regulator [Gulosibacter molinativorax]|uniref:DNA-binding response regulator n=1 Tax=Gulosibacter molinativorax TaxID=256821 RepID=A0ABT7C9U4_9MICO|nr:response regulator transcription factor [Gulosibacter molinativorax]MDJ1371865.1 DNA-binding response regulator [Gulosibacter molinativorax]QUY62514.1 Two component system response regulator [Gulosibacter molinativorax]